MCIEKPPDMPDMAEILGYMEASPAMGRESKGKENWRASQGNVPGQGRGGFRESRARTGDAQISRNGPPPGFSPLNPRNAKGQVPISRGNKMKRQRSLPE